MNDIETIRRTISLYGMLLDDARSDEFGDLFTEEAAWISNTGIYEKPAATPIFEARGRDAIVRIAQDFARHVRAINSTSLHFNAPALIDINGAAANAWWDFVVLYTDKDGFSIRATGRIYAEFVKQGEVWRFAKRANVRSGGVLPPGLAKLPGH